MTIGMVFTISFFGVVGLGVLMVFLLGIVETVCEYKMKRKVQ